MFYFVKNASIGDSWDIISDFESTILDTITFTYTEIKDTTFLGLTDSVKIYTLSGNNSIQNFQFILSKNYGLVKYVPFQQILYRNSTYRYIQMSLMDVKNSTLRSWITVASIFRFLSFECRGCFTLGAPIFSLVSL